MTDNTNDILLERFFREAAQQQVEDNGFTERVMERLPQGDAVRLTHRLSRLWTWFCIAVGIVLFVVLDGTALLRASLEGLLSQVWTWLEVLVTTAPTADVSLNPVTVLLLVAFAGVYLPYQTYRTLCSIP